MFLEAALIEVLFGAPIKDTCKAYSLSIASVALMDLNVLFEV